MRLTVKWSSGTRMVLCHLSRVLALLAIGCSQEEAFEQDASSESLAVEHVSEALNSSPVTNDFVVYAKNSIKVGDRSRINGRDVGVKQAGSGPFLQSGYELAFSAQSRGDPSRSILANRVLLSNGSVVGDVQTNQLSDNGATHGTVASWGAMPRFPAPSPVTPGTTSLTVNSGQTFTIGAGRYATVTVNGLLRLSGGVVEMARLAVGNDARIEAMGATKLRITGKISVADRGFVGPKAGTGLHAGDLRIEASGVNGTWGGLNEWPRAVAIGNDSLVRATIIAPNGTITTGQRTVVTGALAGKDVFVDNDSTVNFESGLEPECAPADCSDGNPCTVDTCDTGTCNHVNAAPGADCSDGDACNGDETCDYEGRCVGGAPIACDDGNPCTDDNCSPVTGCVHSNNADPCDDKEACTLDDTCSGGSCVGGAWVQCRGIGPYDNPVSAACGENACGKDGYLHTCGSAGWTGTSEPCPDCHCEGLSGDGGAVITTCGQSACDTGHEAMYNCSDTGWTDSGLECPQCEGMGAEGTEVTAWMGEKVCGSDELFEICTQSGWAPTGEECEDCSDGSCDDPFPKAHSVLVTVIGPTGAPLPDAPVYALNSQERVFFTGITDGNGIATMTVDEGTYLYGADVSSDTGVRSAVLCAAPACTQVTLDASIGATTAALLDEGRSGGERRDLGTFLLNEGQGERLIPLGIYPYAAGTTLRLGTYHADGDLLGAYAFGDTSLRLYERKPDGSLRILAENDDAGMDPDTTASEDVRGASYISFTLARSATLVAGLTCKSGQCRASTRLKADVDSNGGLTDVAAALGRVETGYITGRRSKLNFQSGSEGWFSDYDDHYYLSTAINHFQGVQRMRLMSGLDVNSQNIALSGSAAADLFRITYPSNGRNPSLLGPQPEDGTGGSATAHAQFHNNHQENHLGGIQASGHYLGGGFDGTNGGQGMVMIWDVDTQTGSAFHPVYLWFSDQNASAVGLAKPPGQNAPMVMVVGGANTSFVRLLRKPPNRWGYTNPAAGSEDSRWTDGDTRWPSPSHDNPEPSAEWPDGSLDVSTAWPYARECCLYTKWGVPYDCLSGTYCGTSRQVFQSLQLLIETDEVTHAARRVLLAGAYATGESFASGRLEVGTDEVTLFELKGLTAEKLRAPVDATLGLIPVDRIPVRGNRRLVFTCAYGAWRCPLGTGVCSKTAAGDFQCGNKIPCVETGDHQCSFNASFGLYIDPDDESVTAYSSRAFRPDNGGPITITEFGPRPISMADNLVELCTEATNGQNCVVLTPQQKFFPTPASIGLPNDEISSIRVGRNVVLLAFDQGGFAFNTYDSDDDGRDWRLYEPADYPYLDTMNDRISSVIVRWKSEVPQRPGVNQVTVCDDADGGALCSVLDVGEYPNPTGAANLVDGTDGSFGLTDNWMSSVILPPGGKVTLYPDADFQGTPVELWNGLEIYQTINLTDHNINDSVSSVWVLGP